MATSSSAVRTEVPTVTVKQIADFPVDSSLFQVHGRIVELDSPTADRKPGIRRLPFGNMGSIAAVLQDKEGSKITVEAVNRDATFLQYISDKCAQDETIILYRPVVTSCRYVSVTL